MELKLDIANIAFDGLYDALACGEVDVLISALPYDPLRTQDVTYSPPYAVDGLAWLYREGSSAQDPDTFRGEILAEAGSEAAYLGRERWPEARVVEVPSEAEVVARLRAGAEAGLTTRVSACTLGLPGDGIALGPLFNEVPYSVAVRASNAALAQAVMDALGQVLAGEEWRMAVDSWLGEGC
jgi:ABC-type amino acid transport substrate-binding protein